MFAVQLRKCYLPPGTNTITTKLKYGYQLCSIGKFKLCSWMINAISLTHFFSFTFI